MKTDNGNTRRTLFFKALNIMAGTYFLLVTLMFVAVIIYSGWLSEMVSLYEFKWVRNPLPVILVASIQLLLNGSALAGIILMHLRNPYGIQIFVISTGILLVSHLFLRNPDWYSFGWISLLLFLYIMHYKRSIPLNSSH